MRPMTRFLKFFFWHFYHGFAWTYDFVAAFVSIGRWNDWIRSVLPYVEGQTVLELGHGPGHLQLCLRQKYLGFVVGLDESAQMGRLASARLLAGGCAEVNLIRGLGQLLPFRAGAFDTVVSTFPTEYVFEPETLSEVKRVLISGGCFVVAPAAWMMSRKSLHRASAWLFRVTGQVPRFPPAVLAARLRGVFEQAGFRPEFTTVSIRSSEVLIVVARP